MVLLYNGSPKAGADLQALGAAPSSWEGSREGEARRRGRWPTWLGLGRVSVLAGAGRAVAQASQVRGAGEAGTPRAAGCASLCLLPPPGRSLSTSKRTHERGVPREAQPSGGRAGGRGGLYSCQADGEELTLPTRLLPRPPAPPAGPAHTFNPLRVLEHGQARPACRRWRGRGPGATTWVRVSG